MNWDALGAIGEVVGAIAVVLTLAYLALQIRQNSQSIRQQSYHDLLTRRLDHFREMGGSDDVTEILVDGCRGEAMDPIRAQRFTALMLNYMSHYQDVFIQRKNGLVEEDVWLAERQFLCAIIELPGVAQWWKVAAQYFIPEFVDEVSNLESIPLVIFDQEAGKWALGPNW